MTKKEKLFSQLAKYGKMKRVRVSLVIISVLLLGLYFYFSSFQSTDDAFIEGHLVFVSAQVAGEVTDVKVEDNQEVKNGDLLLEIDPRQYQYNLDVATADFESAQAELKQAAEDEQRYDLLLKHKDISQQEYDRAVLKARNARAHLARVKAVMEQAELDLEHTKVKTAIDGRISAKSAEKGQYVQAGQPLLSVVSNDVWVVANFKETQMAHIVPGARATITVDAYPGLRISAHVDSIQSGTGAVFSLLPAQNASGNFIKVVQRVPVKIVFDRTNKKLPFLYPGLSVKAYVRTRGK